MTDKERAEQVLEEMRSGPVVDVSPDRSVRIVAAALAQARADGYDEALQKGIVERNAIYSASELGTLADELDEENFATAAKKLRAAIMTIDRLSKAVVEEREACAKLAEGWTARSQRDVDEAGGMVAEAIRSRGEPDDRPLRARIESVLAGILPEGAQVTVLLPGKVDNATVTIGVSS